jgi:O-antigen chain-terminating methyltransferase
VSNDFYRAFEDRFRGSRVVIKKRLEVYAPFLAKLKDTFAYASAVDLGCGRGEWLELLGEQNFVVEGVDIDDAMLAACREIGIKVQTGDAITFLKSLPTESVSLVTAFHLVEHIPFSDLLVLAADSMRVLRPGGLLILETPNPENLVVGSSSFYLDPTHERPIPSELLAFVADYSGFKRVKTLRLQEHPGLITEQSPSLMAVLNGASPDYAVIAQKDAPADLLDRFDVEFAREYGLRLDTLALRFQHQCDHTHSLALQALAKAEQLNAHAQGLEERLQAMLASRSWRVTSPLRWLSNQVTRLREDGVCSRSKSFVMKFARIIKRIGRRDSHEVSTQKMLVDFNVLENLNNLSPRALEIYKQLKQGVHGSNSRGE